MAMKGAVKKDNMVAKSIRNLMCDPKNVIVGLYAKGRALKDNTGFVQDV